MRTSLALIVILNLSCTTDFTDKEKTSVTREVKHVLDNYYTDIAKDGLTAEFNYLDNSKEFFWVPPGYKHFLSRDSVVSILKQNAPMFKSINNSWDTLRVVPLTPGLASYTGRLRSLMTDTLGKTTEYVLVETGLLIKRKEGWKLLSGQTSILSE